MIDFVNESGLGSIGTADMAVRADRPAHQAVTAASAATCSWPTNGPTPRHTHRSYELIAHHVVPQFQGQATRRSRPRHAPGKPARPELAQQSITAVEMMTKKYQDELAARTT